jgi:hypothetical protein
MLPMLRLDTHYGFHEQFEENKRCIKDALCNVYGANLLWNSLIDCSAFRSNGGRGSKLVHGRHQ